MGPPTGTMTGSQILMAYERMGLTKRDFARLMGVKEGVVHSWTRETHQISLDNERKIEALLEDFDAEVDRWVTEASDAPLRINIYLTDEEYHDAYESPYPASWHRAVVREVMERAPRAWPAYPWEQNRNPVQHDPMSAFDE